MEDPENLNRRKFPRIQYPCLIVIRNGDGSAETKQTMLTHTENIGVGGLCISLKNSLKVYSSIDIELDLLDLEDHLNCKGKVVWCIKRDDKKDGTSKFYDIGIEFGDVSEEYKKRLGKIVKQKEKK